MLLVLAMSTAALAQEAAYYHPEQVAGHSVVFARAAEASAPQFQKAQSSISRYSKALEQLEIGVLVATSRLNNEAVTRAESLRREFMGTYMQTNAHVNLLQTDYDNVFTGALENALATGFENYTVTECGATGVAALTGRSNCKGIDINKSVATKIDADPQLSAAVDEINSIPWPEFSLEAEEQASIPLLGGSTGDPQLVMTWLLTDAFMRDLINTHQDDLDRALSPLDEGLENNDPESVAHAQALRKTYDEQVSADGAALLDAVEATLARLAKKNGLETVSLCVNPVELGGCSGTDQSLEIIQLLKADRKFTKSLTHIGI